MTNQSELVNGSMGQGSRWCNDVESMLTSFLWLLKAHQVSCILDNINRSMLASLEFHLDQLGLANGRERIIWPISISSECGHGRRLRTIRQHKRYSLDI
jgi:hypothetical protein